MELFLLLGALVASGLFSWFMTSLLDIIGFSLIEWGIKAQQASKRAPGDEQDAWLFTLLLSVTRIPVIILSGIAFFLYLLTLFDSSPMLILIQQIITSTFWIVFMMREGSILLGSFLLGPAMKEIMKTLRG